MSDNTSTTIFKDLTIIELSSVLAGPAVGLFFAELGAKVIKIENKLKGGDVTRSWKHSVEDPKAKSSAYYHSVNWNKEALFVDLADQQDYNKVSALIESADIVISNYRPTTAIKLKLDYDSIKQINPSIIFGLITAYGDEDDRPGFDALLQAETGWMYMNGQADSPPTKMPVALIDLLAAHQLKEGLLVALIKKLKTGTGSKVTVSLYDAAVSALANQASNFLNLGIIPQRKGSQHPTIAPYGDLFITKDNKYILLAVGNDNQFRKLCTILDCTNLSDNPDYKTNAARVTNRAALIDKLEPTIKKITSNKLITLAIKHDVPLGPIKNLEELFRDNQSQKLILSQEESDGSESKRIKTAVFKLS